MQVNCPFFYQLPGKLFTDSCTTAYHIVAALRHAGMVFHEMTFHHNVTVYEDDVVTFTLPQGIIS